MLGQQSDGHKIWGLKPLPESLLNIDRMRYLVLITTHGKIVYKQFVGHDNNSRIGYDVCLDQSERCQH